MISLNRDWMDCFNYYNFLKIRKLMIILLFDQFIMTGERNDILLIRLNQERKLWKR